MCVIIGWYCASFRKGYMKELVFITSDDVFTNSYIIAECAGLNSKNVVGITERYIEDFEEFGELKVTIQTDTSKKVYLYNEQQTTLLFTYLKNSEKVRTLKKELVKQFFLMREELKSRKTALPIYLETRRTLTDTIKELPESDHKRFKYKQYTDLVYKLVLGKTAAKYKKDIGLSKNQSVVSFLTSGQLDMISDLSKQTSLLLTMGFNYEQIKSGLYNLYDKIKDIEPEYQYKLCGI